ncbi:hypothetical protein U1Q18_049690 [Sarracenia purpurea var. burkii]
MFGNSAEYRSGGVLQAANTERLGRCGENRDEDGTRARDRSRPRENFGYFSNTPAWYGIVLAQSRSRVVPERFKEQIIKFISLEGIDDEKFMLASVAMCPAERCARVGAKQTESGSQQQQPWCTAVLSENALVEREKTEKRREKKLRPQDEKESESPKKLV